MLARLCLLCRRVQYQYQPLGSWGLEWRLVHKGAGRCCEHSWTFWTIKRCRCGAMRHRHPAITGLEWQRKPFVFPDLNEANEMVPAKYKRRKERAPVAGL